MLTRETIGALCSVQEHAWGPSTPMGTPLQGAPRARSRVLRRQSVRCAHSRCIRLSGLAPCFRYEDTVAKRFSPPGCSAHIHRQPAMGRRRGSGDPPPVYSVQDCEAQAPAGCVLAKCIGIPRAKAWVPVGQALKRNVRELEQSVSKEEKQARGGGRGTEGAERTALDDDEVCARCAPEPPPSRTRPARPGQARAHMLAFQVKGPFPACRRRPAGAATASSITPPSPTRATSKTAGCMTTRMGAPECLCSHVCWLCAGV